MSTLRIRGPENTAKPVWTVTQNLDGFVIEFRAQWLISEEYWIFHILDGAGETIIDGLRIVEGNDLLYPFSDLRLPPGRLICHDTTRTHREPGRNAFFEDHALYYIQPEVVEIVEPVRVTEIGEEEAE